MLTLARTWIKELIGGTQRLKRFILPTVITRTTPTFDTGTADYAYLDKARHGRIYGLKISGLLLKPIASKITSWSIGKPPTFKAGNPAATEGLATWWRSFHANVIRANEESLNLADYYIVINADRTVTLLPPDVVTPIVNPEDFGKIIGWRVEIVYDHPTEVGRTQTQRNEYYADRREETVITAGRPTRQRTYRNLIGRIPVVHIANNVAANEMFGHCEWEDLIPILQEYGAVFEAAIEGNIRHGRPTPTIEQMGSAKAVEAFWSKFGKTKTVTHADGTTETENYLEWDADKLMTLGETATFGWKAPPPFMSDVNSLLQLMYYLLVEHCEIPEGFLGNAIASSQASLNTQMEPLIKFIEKKRSMAQAWVLEVCEIVLALLNVVTPSISLETPEIVWDDLTSKDGTLTLQTVQWAYGEGLLDEETALMLLPIEIENPKEVLAKAKEEKQVRQDAFNAGADQRLADAQARAQSADNQAADSINLQGAQPAAA